MTSMLTIDGAHGEGGGQIIRTTLTLATILNQPVHIKNIRAKRKNPGLAAQHLTAVRASAMICEANIRGDQLRSTELTFIPQSAPVPGLYAFDVAEAREGGSAGAATLVLQTILVPLALASRESEVTVRGGTHVPWSPPFHYLQDVYLPMLERVGFQAFVAALSAWGWYPAGEGEIRVEIPGQIKLGQGSIEKLWPERGPLKHITGVAVASSLPAHIAQRMSDRAMKLLDQAGLPAAVEPQRVRSVSPGAGLFLVAEYENSRAGFSVLGKKGKTSELVAEETVRQLLVFHRSDAVIDKHLTDQLILPIALSGLIGPLSVEDLTSHTLTNLWIVEQFLGRIANINHKNSTIEFIPRSNVLP